MQLTLENKSESNIKTNKKIKLPTAYTILFSIIVIISIITHFIDLSRKKLDTIKNF